MKKLILLFLLLFPLWQCAYSISVTGKVLDSYMQGPIEFVKIVLFDANSKVPIKSSVTDSKGKFKMEVDKQGQYMLSFTYIGYKTVKYKFALRTQMFDVGTIILVAKTEKLSQVEVVGQGSQMHLDLDKKVFSVDKNIASSGGSVTEVLKNIPSVEVDVEGNISMRNDNNVEIRINGKPAGLTVANRAQILEQMPADELKSVEIITNPSAKYSASGTAGIINLVTKESKIPGYFGGIMLGMSRAGNGKMGALCGANLNYSNKKIDMYANVGYRDVVKQGYGWTDRYRMTDSGETTKLRKDNTKSHENKSPFVRAGVDYRLNASNTIGLSGFGLFTDETADSYTQYVKTLTTDNSNMKRYSRINTTDGHHASVHLSVDYCHEFNKDGSNLKVSVTYSRHRDKAANEFFERDSFPILGTTDLLQNKTNSTAHLNFKLDYTKQFSKHSKLEIGWHTKTEHTLATTNGLDLSTSDSIADFYNRFDYHEQIHAAYASYSAKLGAWKAMTGLRAENMSYYSDNKTATYMQHVPRKKYFGLFPSAFLSYTLPARQELQLNYTRRINRPSSIEINPFRDYSDANDVDYGNSLLSPSYAASIEFNYVKNWSDHTLFASVYYKLLQHSIEEVSFVSPTNADLMENTLLNIPAARKAGLELMLKNNLWNVLDLTSALNVYYNKRDSAVYTDESSGLATVLKQQEDVAWTGKLIANVTINHSLTAQMIAEYASDKIVSQGKRSPNYSIDAGLRKTFMHKNLALSLTVRDILASDRKKTTLSGIDFSEITESVPHGRTIRLTLHYTFGNMKSKKRAELEKKHTDLPDVETEDAPE